MYPLHRKADLVVQEVEDETLVYDLRTHKARCLNSTSSRVWKLCDGARSSDDIAAVLSASWGSEVSVEIVDLAVDQLAEQDLLEDGVALRLPEGRSRRELLKNAGLAAAIAIPAISVITAPMAAQAQSSPLVCVPATHGCTCSVINTGRKGQQCVPSVPCATDCRCVHANNGNNFTGDCVV